MREWKLKTGDPLSLTLVSDARLGPTDYLNDHIWELSLGGGEPEALALETTFGLRAKSLRVFPRFRENEITLTHPEDFAQAVVIQQIYPNYIKLRFAPFEDIKVQAEYWVPRPHTIAIRLKFENNSKTNRHIYVDWIGQLFPTEGQRMAVGTMEASPILYGETDRLRPVLFNTGTPKEGSGSYPSLMTTMELALDATRQFTCVAATLEDQEQSFLLARRIAALNWEAEIARLELTNGGQIEIFSGNHDWDAALMLSQKLAISLLVDSTQALPHPSFVFTRRPDQGYSLSGDGLDYDHYWNGQTPLESYYLSSLIMPFAVEFCKGLLLNFLAVQEQDGSIDWKPGLAGQRSRKIATPILASLAWKIYQQTEDLKFLEEIFSGLLRFLRRWFSADYDRDGDGIPEWDSPLQFGADEHPVYSEWHDWSQEIEINTAEGPALCSFLYRECQTLIKIAELIGQQTEIKELEGYAKKLYCAVEDSWDEETSSYYDWDRDTHHSTKGEWLGGLIGSGGISIEREFEQPIRLAIKLQIKGTNNRDPIIFVHGKSATGKQRVERITYEDFKWKSGFGNFSGQLVYSMLKRIDIQGLEEDDEITFQLIGYSYPNLTLLAPLWANIPGQERAEQLVENTITNPDKFWHPFGMPFCSEPPDHPEARECRSVHPIWNMLIGEGLVQYGYRSEAAELVKRNLNAIAESLKHEKAFHRYYHADSGKGVGVHNILSGLAPMGFFLEVLGVQLISPHKVILEGQNPFEGPVTIKYRGLTVLRQKEKTSVIFPDGQTVEITDTERHIITLE